MAGNVGEGDAKTPMPPNLTMHQANDLEEITSKMLGLDDSGNGLVERTVLASVLHDLEPDALTAEAVDIVIKSMDEQVDGKIDVAKFVRWVMLPGSKDSNVPRRLGTGRTCLFVDPGSVDESSETLHLSGPQQVVMVYIEGISELGCAEYRVGDITKGLISYLKGEYKMKPKVTITLHSDYSAEGVSVTTQPVDAFRYRKSPTSIGETLLLLVPSEDGPVPIEKLSLELQVHNEVGIQSAIVGDPLVGAGQLRLSSEMVGQTVQVPLLRNDEEHGQLLLKVSSCYRPPRTLILAVKSLHSFSMGIDLEKKVATHWGMGILDSEGGVQLYEVSTAGMDTLECPMSVFGPRGLVAHSVPADEWEEWRQTVTDWMIRKEFLPPDILQRMQEHISDEEWKSLITSRPYTDETFDAERTKIGYTFRSDEEIEEFICVWVQDNPEYRWDCNCQNFCKDFYTFLTCGDDLERWTIDEGIEAVIGHTPANLLMKGIQKTAVEGAHKKFMPSLNSLKLWSSNSGLSTSE